MSLRELWVNADPAFLIYVRAVVERCEDASREAHDGS